ncbi:MAG: hypothetical protein QOJ70_111 [Acidobacteriota bacterium]|jgi:hypothetical protein|nr:hypothetical protein [Acidobacteriota bacterium]
MQAAKILTVQDGGRPDSSLQTAIPNSWLTRLFGCRHRKMSPPFSGPKETYRSCMNCGARRLFSVERGKMTGAYYYAPLSSLYESPLSKRLPGEKGNYGDR